MSQKINIGDWIETKSFGESVCIGIENEHIQLRYPATRKVDNKELWVANGERINDVQFLREKDKVSEYVLTLEGPYGEGVNRPKNKI